MFLLPFRRTLYHIPTRHPSSYDFLVSPFGRAEAALVVAPRFHMRQLLVSLSPKESSNGVVVFP
jgi:hypothetical protein